MFLINIKHPCLFTCGLAVDILIPCSRKHRISIKEEEEEEEAIFIYFMRCARYPDLREGEKNRDREATSKNSILTKRKIAFFLNGKRKRYEGRGGGGGGGEGGGLV